MARPRLCKIGVVWRNGKEERHTRAEKDDSGV